MSYSDFVRGGASTKPTRTYQPAHAQDGFDVDDFYGKPKKQVEAPKTYSNPYVQSQQP